MSIQFDLPISVMVWKNLRTPGGNALARSNMNGSTISMQRKTSESASTSCSTRVRSLSRTLSPLKFRRYQAARSKAIGLSELDRAWGALAKPDEIEIARVDHETGRLADNENGIDPVAGIGEQHDPAEEAEIPTRLGHGAGPRLFRRYPLHEKAHGEQELSAQADADPDELGGRRCAPPLNKTRCKGHGTIPPYTVGRDARARFRPPASSDALPEMSSAIGGICVRLRSQLTPTRSYKSEERRV